MDRGLHRTLSSSKENPDLLVLNHHLDREGHNLLPLLGSERIPHPQHGPFIHIIMYYNGRRALT